MAEVRNFSNNAKPMYIRATLGDSNPTDTITISSAISGAAEDGSTYGWPDPPFFAIIDAGAGSQEVVKVTNKTTSPPDPTPNIYTITRGSSLGTEAYGSTTVSHTPWAVIYPYFAAADMYAAASSDNLISGGGVITNDTATNIGLTIKGASGQSVSNFLVKDNSNNTIFSVNNTGVTVGSNAIAISNGTGGINTNTTLGTSTLSSGSQSGGLNTAVGYRSLKSATTTSSSTGVGYAALENLTTGFRNTAVGSNSLSAITTGIENTTLGYGTGSSLNSSQSYNVIIGTYALSSTSGASSSNTIIGWQAAGRATGAPSSNVIIGAGAYIDNTGGSGSVVIGANALKETALNSGSVAIGSYAGAYETVGGKLFIDAVDRSTEANGRSRSLIYGIFNSTVSSQYLTINGNTTISQTLAVTGKSTMASDVEITGALNGVILTTDDGTKRYRVRVANDGSLTTVLVT